MNNNTTSKPPEPQAPSCCGEPMNDITEQDLTGTWGQLEFACSRCGRRRVVDFSSPPDAFAAFKARNATMLSVLSTEAKRWSLSELRHAVAFWRKGPEGNMEARALAEVAEEELDRRLRAMEAWKAEGVEDELQNAIERDWPE